MSLSPGSSGSPEQAASETRYFRYTFSFEDGTERTFEVHLDPVTLALVAPISDPLPEWTRLENEQCPNCPLSPKRAPHCPIAARVVPLLQIFGGRESHELCLVTVEGPQRTYSRRTSLQRGLSSLLGIFMVSSGCPVMDKLRPMLDTHLPFASQEETIYRMISSYLVTQYFRQRKGWPTDWRLKDFPARLQEISTVDRAFAKRLRSVGIRDAGLNAIVILNTFGEMTSFTIEEEDWDRLEALFLRAETRDAPVP
ncbi:MAG: hypothetical protein D6679_05750 [Candidatus Hydrogenedentota bacterium]|nr:MAG: hypothetical protein D6679_05750 [Candidatus Hydrogenedentota bacterium]